MIIILIYAFIMSMFVYGIIYSTIQRKKIKKTKLRLTSLVPVY